MGALRDLTGMRFGKLVVTKRNGHIGQDIAWLCQCDCGREHTTRGISLTTGKTASCGCANYSSAKEFKEKYGENVKTGIAKEEYAIWKDIKKRCYNKRSTGYALYGARGIIMCEEWKNSFTKFYDYLGPRPGKEFSVDRIDPNGDYQHGNVRWATDGEQARGHCLHSTNTTGTSNVYFRYHKRKKSTSCCAEVSVTENGERKRKCKEFSVRKYGLLPAMMLAVEWREQEIKELEKQGVFYSEKHGTKRERKVAHEQ